MKQVSHSHFNAFTNKHPVSLYFRNKFSRVEVYFKSLRSTLLACDCLVTNELETVLNTKAILTIKVPNIHIKSCGRCAVSIETLNCTSACR